MARDRAVRDAGFGREVKGALALRRQWLIDQPSLNEGLATESSAPGASSSSLSLLIAS